MNHESFEKAARFQSARHKEAFAALLARRGEKTACALRGTAEMLWLNSQALPPVEVIKSSPDRVVAILTRLQELQKECLLHNVVEWLCAAEGRDLSQQEVTEVFLPEMQLIFTLLNESEKSIITAAKTPG